MAESNKQEQLDELESLAEIFDEKELSFSKGRTSVAPARSDSGQHHGAVAYEIDPAWVHGTLKVAVEVVEPVNLVVPAAADLPFTQLSLEVLPPIDLRFWLPPEYPTEAKPIIKLRCLWMRQTQLEMILTKLHELWDDTQDAVLFAYAEFLKSESLELLGIEKQLDLGEVNQDNLNKITTLARYLQEYNDVETKRIFDNSTVKCMVCFEEKKGEGCFRFIKCKHEFCKECITGYFETQIKEGDVRNITCLDDSCKSEALPTEIQTLVSPSSYERYDTLLLEVTLSEMQDVTRCPRRHCQQPVIISKDTKMGQCDACQYTFCILCRKAWHGVNFCKTSDLQKFAQEYPNASQERKTELELTYGKENILRIVNEIESELYLNENSKKCPGCGSHISKTDGCNKMTCSRCHAFFCWLCEKQIQGYDHFSKPGSCNGLLFDGMLGVEDDFFFFF
eukprot:m.15202 g.15202  ORF g.15202 m.15202 type:complete len:450 (+) comp5317_c0_seq1:355-1704(+)